MTTKISLITPVKDDVRVFRLIESFQNIINNKNLEFIIVCNGSKKDFIKNISKFTNKIKNLRVFSLKKANIASAINFGVKKSNTERVVIVDSDCVVDTNFYKPMAKALNNNLVVRGLVSFKGTNYFSCLSAKLRTHVYQKENELFFTPNLGFHKKILSLVGNFNELPHNSSHCMDAEFGHRANKSGIKLAHEHAAIITHYCYLNPINEIIVSIRYGQGDAYCYRQGYLGKKSFNNYLKMLALPFVFDKQESVAYNIFVFFYVVLFDFGFLRETFLKRLP